MVGRSRILPLPGFSLPRRAYRLKRVEYAAEFRRNREVRLFWPEELVEWGAE